MLKNLPLVPEGASTLARDVDALTLAAIAVSIFFTVLIFAGIVYLGVRYRRRHEDEVGESGESPLILELTWSFIPLVIVLGFFAWGALVFFKAVHPPADSLEYFVTGKQWMWKIQHPEGHREINELHVPVGQPVKLTMTSEDVIHSFYIPAFRIKTDVLPGRYTTQWFEATKPGEYHLFCAEYCGVEHSMMIGKVVVMEPADYERWLSGARPGQSMALSGKELFQKHACNTCHRDDSSARAPILNGIAGQPVELKNGRTTLADDNYLRESILNPQAKLVRGYEPIMPAYQGQISEEELFELILYVKSLSGDTPSAGEGTELAEVEESGA